MPDSSDIWLSMIIPFSRHSPLGGPCLDSLLGLQGPGVEVLLVDDGSGQKNLAELRETARHSRVPIRFISQAPLGPGTARNLALGQAKGRVVYFSQGQFVQPPDLLNRLQTHFARPGIGVLSGCLRPAPSNSPLRDLTGMEMFFSQQGRELCPSPCPDPACAAFSRQVLLDAGGCTGSPTYGEIDWELCRRLDERGVSLDFDEELMVKCATPATWGGWFKAKFREGRLQFRSALGRRRAGFKAQPGEFKESLQSFLALLAIFVLVFLGVDSPQMGLTLALICLLLLYYLNRPFLRYLSEGRPGLMSLALLLCLLRPFAWLGGLFSAALERLTVRGLNM